MKKSKKKWLGFAVLLLTMLVMGQMKQVVYAAEETITLDTVDETETTLKDLYMVPDQATVTFTLQPTEAVSFGYTRIVKGKNGTTEKTNYVNTFTCSGKEISDEEDANDDSVGVKKVFLTAEYAGTAELTMETNNAGVVTSKQFHIVVKGVKPKIKVKLSGKLIRSSETAYIIDSSKISQNAKVTVSANKNKVVKVAVNGEKKKRVMKKNKPIVCSHDDGLGLEFYPIKAGKVTFTITVEQDGYKVQKKFDLTIVKYVNPFQSFRIGTKDYAKKFDKDPNGGARTKKAEALYTMAKPYSIKMKKGYKLVKIQYRNVGEWSGYHKLKGNVLPKNFWELYITYQDSKGNKFQNSLYYDGSYFNYLQN